MKKLLSYIFLTFLFLGWAGSAFAATQILKTVKPSGGDYTTLQAAIAANAQNLVTNDKYLDIEISGDWSGGADTSSVSITGYTTDSTHYINIYTTSEARHKGLYSTSYYRLEVNNAFGSIFNIGENDVTVTGIQVKNTSGTTGDPYTPNAFHVNDGTTRLLINKVIAIAPQIGIRINSFSGTQEIRNSISIATWNDSVRKGEGIFAGYGTATIRNTIGIHRGQGVGISGSSAQGNITCVNCYARSSTGSAYSQIDTLTTSASSDTTGSAGLQNIAYSISSGAYFTNVTAGSEDFHIGSNSALKDVGTDLSAAFTDDIDGATRSGTWDIGADEFVAAATPAAAVGHPRTLRYGTLLLLRGTLIIR